MKCSCATFPKTLHYESPAHGGWGLVRMAGLLPESYMLFYTPAACGRHSSLGALTNGIKDKVSYLFLDEEEIVSGSYEKQIPIAVDELLEFLDNKPRCLLLFGGCIDDFLGTDYSALKAELTRRHPDVRFCFCHMNPIQLDTKSPPGVTLFTNIYSMLDKREKNPRQINFIGNNVIPNKTSEIWDLLRLHDMEARMLPACSDFDTFLSMAESSLNLIMSPRCMQSAKKMGRELSIPYFPMFPSYSLDELDSFYTHFNAELSRISGKNICFDTTPLREKAEEALKETASEMKGIGIAIDFQATTKPYTLAKTLLDYGFDVKMIAADGVSAFEKVSFEYLQEKYPDLEIVNPLHHDAPKYEQRYLKDSLCIGFDCAYMIGAERIVDLQEDDDLWGYDGVVRLMDLIKKAMNEKSDVMDIIREAKLVV